jgi:hypothetical protein
MGQRTTWKFAYRGADLIAPTQEKVDYHRERLDWWTKEQDYTVEEVRGKGIVLHEQPMTGGYRAQVLIDPTYQQRLDECAAKVQEHRRELEVYEMYLRAFQLNRDDLLQLDAEDLRYFGL